MHWARGPVLFLAAGLLFRRFRGLTGHGVEHQRGGAGGVKILENPCQEGVLIFCEI
jgi:hypothetical protein